MLAIIDYGVGNLFSLSSSFAYIGQEAMITGDPETIRRCDRIVLPGVGAFGDAADKLRRTGLDQILLQEAAAGKPILGICLGMQLLFTRSYEYGEHEGLNLIPGTIRPISDALPAGTRERYKIPHIGWNALHFPTDKPKSPLFRYINEGEHVYFVHSYYAADCAESVIADTEYGATLTAAAGSRNVYGTQFHPEKSGETGLNILRTFARI